MYDNYRAINISLSLIFVLIFSCLFGFRTFDSGVDTQSYVDYFQSISRSETPEFSFEIGFKFLTSVLSLLIEDYLYIYLVTLLQLLFLLIAGLLLRVKNVSLLILLYVSFLPGFDMLTNGVRSGLALSFGLCLFAFIARANHKFINAVIGFAPSLLHASYLIVYILSLFSYGVNSLRKINYILFFSIFISLSFVFIDDAFILEILAPFTSDYGLISKLIRYALIEKELMSLSVKLYFLFLSISLSLLNFWLINKRSIKSDVSIKLYSISVLLFLSYSLLSFSEFSFRFMFLAYPFQIVLLSFLIENSIIQRYEKVILMSLLFFSIFITYSTDTFSKFKFFNFI